MIMMEVQIFRSKEDALRYGEEGREETKEGYVHATAEEGAGG